VVLAEADSSRELRESAPPAIRISRDEVTNRQGNADSIFPPEPVHLADSPQKICQDLISRRREHFRIQKPATGVALASAITSTFQLMTGPAGATTGTAGTSVQRQCRSALT
jgi:hypothetical protein